MSEALISLGIGLRRDACVEALDELVAQALADAGVTADRVALVATLDSRCRAPALLALAARYRWPVRAFAAATLVPFEHRLTHRSPRVRALYGVSGIAEAAALAALETRALDTMTPETVTATGARAVQLLLARRHNARATCALAIQRSPAAADSIWSARVPARVLPNPQGA